MRKWLPMPRGVEEVAGVSRQMPRAPDLRLPGTGRGPQVFYRHENRFPVLQGVDGG